MKKNFANLTNLYSLTKTLKFELKPVLGTKSLQDVIKNDREIDRLYEKEMKPMFDRMHEQFIMESLDGADISIKLLQQIEDELFKMKDYKSCENSKDKMRIFEKNIEGIQEKLRKDVIRVFNNKGNEWKNRYPDIKFKKNGYQILFENNILLMLKDLNPEKEDIIKKFDKFFTYFSGFNKNRENYYSDEDKATSIANRIINENLIRFLDNKYEFRLLSNKINELKKYDEYFELFYYSKCLNSGDIDLYNKKLGIVNEIVNKFFQQNKGILPKLVRLKLLYKQIGCDKTKFGIFQIEEGKEWVSIEELYAKQKDLLKNIENLYQNFFADIDDFDLDSIYFNKASINTVSSRWFVAWDVLSELLLENKIIKNKDRNKGGDFRIPQSISLFDFSVVLKNNVDVINLFRLGAKDQSGKGEYEKLYKNNAWDTFLAIWKHEIKKNFEEFNNELERFNQEKKRKFDIRDEEDKKLIKDFCDTMLSIERMIKYHTVKEFNIKDNSFYEVIDQYCEKSNLNEYYNAFRNYLTKKLYNTNKFKLNFNQSTLASGFDIDKELSNLVVILRGAGIYYLAVIDKNNKNCFSKDKNKDLYSNASDEWEKLNYKYFPSASKMIPKCSTQLKNVIGHFKKNKDEYLLFNASFNKKLTITRRIFDLNNVKYSEDDLNKIVQDSEKGVKLFQKDYLKNGGNKKVYRAALTDWINFCKDFLESYKSCEYFDYSSIKDADDYEYLEDFYVDVDRASYFTEFVGINKGMLERLINDGKIYLFSIYNKDFAEHKTGKDNLETIILKNLFSSDIIKLNGGAELFFRDKSIDKKVDSDRSKKKKFSIIKNKRYSEEKIFFHFSVTLNFGLEDLSYKKFNINFNSSINENYKILGIDRGEKNLLYYSLINQDGVINKQGSLNIINGKDYNSLLTDRSRDMMEARRSWSTIGSIKELKEGYLSQAIHEIYKLSVDNNAIIVLEDLNPYFKAKRTARVEKSIYKKFEVALAKKLNYLSMKDKGANELGGILNAYQLTPLINAGGLRYFESSKQWGVIFYVNPSYTSAIDPLTGWRKTKYISNSISEEIAREEFGINSIKIDFDKKYNCFKFNYDDWNLFAYDGIERFYWNKNEKDENGKFGKMKKYNLFEELEKLFLGLDKNRNINEQIITQKEFDWKSLVFYWNLLNQIRNTNREKQGNENDFLQSPVWSNKINDFYDSRKKYKINLPDNGDANGAYNIARKGMILLDRIKNNPDSPDLFIRNDDWDKFVQR
ncbi:type V CRISPR-associated protein Cas12a/Cpf1 [bacterium]|nr:type V CRISPR-associated protein Cas12a/Cpf1 [bacterium]